MSLTKNGVFICHMQGMQNSVAVEDRGEGALLQGVILPRNCSTTA